MWEHGLGGPQLWSGEGRERTGLHVGWVWKALAEGTVARHCGRVCVEEWTSRSGSRAWDPHPCRAPISLATSRLLGLVILCQAMEGLRREAKTV